MSHAPSTRHIARFLWIKLLAVVFLAVFLSTLLQYPALMGSHGLLPAKNMVVEATRLLPEAWKRYWMFPGFCWVSASDLSLLLQCAVGLAASCALLAGFLPGPLLLLCWALHLSLAQAGQDFFHGPFDDLLLECGLLAALLAPWRWRWSKADPSREAPPSRWETALALALLFKVFFLPGLGHLTLGDSSWSTLTVFSSLTWTQALPTRLGCLLPRLPLDLLKWLALGIVTAEVAAPLLLLAPARARRWAFVPLALLALGSASTGDTVWTGVLLLGLALWSLDDEAFPPVWRACWLKGPAPDIPLSARSRWPRRIVLGLYTAGAAVTLTGFLFGLFGYQPLGSPGNAVYRAVYPFRSLNAYLPSEPVATRRLDLTVEGTLDGQTWKEYPFRAKPGDVNAKPSLARWTPRRFDAACAAAARKDCQQSPFLAQLCASLVEGDPAVLGLFREDPFGGKRPAAVRVMKYDYRLPGAGEWKSTGTWWAREPLGELCPEIKLPK